MPRLGFLFLFLGALTASTSSQSLPDPNPRLAGTLNPVGYPCAAAVSCQLPSPPSSGVTGASADAPYPVQPYDCFRVTEDASLSRVCWSGIYLDPRGSSARPGPDPADRFQVTYFALDAVGLPGAVRAGPFAADVVGNPTGGYLPGAPRPFAEYSYVLDHEPVAVTRDERLWIKIRRIRGGGANSRWFWRTAADGDGQSYRGASPVLGDFDLSFCLDVPFASGGCGARLQPDDLPTLNRNAFSPGPAVLGELWDAGVRILDPASPATGNLLLLFNTSALPRGPILQLAGGPSTQLLLPLAGTRTPCALANYTLPTSSSCPGLVIPNDLALLDLPWCGQVAVGTPADGFTLTNAACGFVSLFPY